MVSGLKMTLIVHIPYNEGVVIVADNQNTYGDYTIEESEPIDKSLVKPEKNFVLVCAGKTLLFQNMYHTLKVDNSIDNTTIKEKIKEYIRTAQSDGTLARTTELPDIEIFLVTRADNTVVSLDMIGQIERDSIKPDSFSTIGSKIIPNQLRSIKFNVSTLTQDDAIQFGIYVINLISEIDKKVGHTKKFGATIIIIPKSTSNTIQKISKSAEELSQENIFKFISVLITQNKIVI